MKFFQGRLMHIIPAKEKPQAPEQDILGPNGTKLSKVKKEKEAKRKNLAGSDFNWSTLYMSVSLFWNMDDEGINGVGYNRAMLLLELLPIVLA